MATRRRPPDDRQLGFDGLWAEREGAAPRPPTGSESLGAPIETVGQPPSSPVQVPPPVPPSPPLAPVIPLRRRPLEVPEDPFPSARIEAQPAPPRQSWPAEDSELPLSQALRLERNLALLAGAGAGKTYSLVTMCLHLLGGARADAEPLEPHALCLLTFTEKAAGEMRARLRERLAALADGRDEEPDLRASFAKVGRPFPPRATWRTLRDGLGAATIGTFHSMCTQLLRRAPPGAGVNPNFELLDERDARRLVREVTERVVLERVQTGDAETRHLVTEFGFDALVGALTPVFMRIREEGQSPRYVQIGDASSLRRQFDSALLELKTATARALATAQPKHRLALEEFAAMLRETTFEAIPEQVPRLRLALNKHRTEPFTSLRAWVRPWDRKEGDAEKNLALLHGACVMAPHEAAVRDLLAEVEKRHRVELDRRGVLDFTGLLVEARTLLRDVPSARADAQRRTRALLVDEFQDTNRVQLELVLLLAERRQGAPRPISDAFEAQHREILELPLEPGALAVVGDRKQAIYEFRGADVGVFSTLARCLVREGGARAFLRHSRRSSAPLVEALNVTMAKLLSAEHYSNPLREFEVVYEPHHDDLVAVREQAIPARPLLLLTQPEDPELEGATPLDAAALRDADADGIARILSKLLTNPDSQVVDRKTAQARRTRGGDVAVLFQRFTQLEGYRQALVRHGVRHRVVRGRGFFGAQEVVDVACALALLSDPDDALALAAVLRSPLVGLTDSALVELALPEPGFETNGLRPRQVLEGGRRPTASDAVSMTRLERFIRLFRQLHPERDRLGLRALVRAVLDGTALRVSVAAAPFGEQGLANLDKLLELATARDRAGESVASFARELLDLADAEPTEAQGEVVDELDLDAVTLCTVHQAKGLEWPVVVLPDLNAPARHEGAAVRFDRAAGLGLKPPATDEGELQSLSLERVSQQLAARANAERLRLLYVAMTRARDRVVLGLMSQKPRPGSWANDLQPLRTWNDLRPRVEEVDVSTLPAGSPPSDALMEVDQALSSVDQVLQRVRHGPVATARQAMLPVTQLQDFATCPRRYWLAHQLGVRDASSRGEPALHADVDVRERGTAAHRLIELTPLEAVTTGLEPALELIRRTEELDAATPEVLGWVTRFWRSRFGTSLAALGDTRVHRELPFVLSLRDEPSGFTLNLRGQIDLLVESPDGSLLVIDYKTALVPPAGLAPYRFQLGCYSLAAQRFAGRTVRARAGIVFLREQDVEPRYLDEVPSVEALEAELASQARALTESQVSGAYAGRPRPRCEAIHCGFVYRCHP